MNAIDSLIPLVTLYQPSLMALTLLCLSVMLQALLTPPLAFIKGEQAPGMPLVGDHASFSFRVLRTHANSVESLPAFGLILILAIVIGAHPTAVNWLVVLHLIFRLLFWAVYYSGVGRAAGGIRTLAFVGALFTSMGLVFAVLYRLHSLFA